MLGGIVKNAPNALIWAVTLCFVCVIGAFVYLSASGSDSTDLRTFINTTLNIVAALFSGGALIVAGAAAKSSGNTETQTNHHAEKDARLQNQSATIDAYRKDLANAQRELADERAKVAGFALRLSPPPQDQP